MATIKARVGPQNSVKTRVGPQNSVRVLSSAIGAPTKLLDLIDVNEDLKTKDGMILVWDLPTQTFIMTSVIDSSSTTIQGIAYFTNTENSSLPTDGALIVSGGVGVGKNLNVGGGLAISGLSTFSSDLDVNASVDIGNSLNVGGGLAISGLSTFSSDLDINASVDINNILNVDSEAYFVDITSTGISSFNAATIVGGLTVDDAVVSGALSVGATVTLSSSGGITTTGGDLYVGNNLYVSGISTFIGSAIFRGGTIGIGDSVSDDINVGGEFVSNLVPNTDDAYDLGITGQRWRDGKFSGLVTSTNLFVSGLSTFIGNQNLTGNLSVTGFTSVTEGLYYDTGDFDGPNGIAYFDNTGKLIGAASTESLISSSYYILTTEEVSGVPVWTSTIDGGIY